MLPHDLKEFMKNYIQKISIAVFALGALFAFAPSYTYAAFNTAPNDCPTVMVANYTTQQNISSTCWGTSATANSGETINVRIYYHNTDTNPAPNTIVHLNDPRGASQSTFNFTGFVNSSASGSGSVSVSTPHTLTLSHVYWYPDKSISPQALPNGQSDESLFTSGVNLGTIPGWNTCPSSDGFCHSGSVVASFIVSGSTNTGNTTGTCAINTFSINGSQTYASVAYNTPATLAWTTSNCTSVTVAGQTFNGSQATSGSVSTSNLTQTQNFNLTATNGTNSIARTVTARVTGGGSTTGCSITSFTVNGSQTYASVAYNSPATLAWITNGCTTVVVNGQTYTGSSAISGSTSTSNLTASQNFTLTATGADGSHTANVTVSVGGQNNTVCSISSFTVNGMTGSVQIAPNTSATLSWVTNGCTTVSVNGQTYTGAQANAYSVNTGNLNGSYTYTLTASDNSGNTVTSILYVTVSNNNYNNGSCQILSFSPAQNSIYPGSSTTLTWTLSGCTGYVTVSGPNMSTMQVYNNYVTTGPINSYSTYTLTAYGANGTSATANTYVNTNGNGNNYYQSCYISSFTVNGSSVSAPVAPGSSATIAWGTNGCSYVTISGPGMYSQNQSLSGTTTTAPLYTTSTYTISASSYSYGSPVSQSVTVNVGGVYNTANLAPITTIATNVTSSSARLNGLIPQAYNSGTVNAYFEYGASYSLGSQTSPQPVSTYTLTNYYDTITVSPNTTYYFRAVMNVNNAITKGDIVSFTTPGYSANIAPVVVNQVSYGTGSGSSYATVSISDQVQTVLPGDMISYTVSYKNISTKDLSNVVLSVILPKGVTFKSTTAGVPTTDNTVVLTLGTLPRDGQGGFVNIQATVDTNATVGSNLVSTATLAFTLPSGAQDTAVAYYLNTVIAQNNLGAFVLFGNGFFPTTLLGWVLLIGLIIIIILLARRYSRTTTVVQNGHGSTDTHTTTIHH